MATSRMDQYSPSRSELRSMEAAYRSDARDARAKERRTNQACLLVRLAKVKLALISKLSA